MDHCYLVVGLGSMGKRRVRDLKALSAGRIIGVDSRPDRLAEVTDRFGIETADDFEAALKEKPRMVFVSLPPHLHHRFCTAALDAGAAYFVECLTTVTMADMEDLIARDRKEPGRAFPSVTTFSNEYCRYAADKVQQAGKVYAIHASLATWLPNQHPWENEMGIHYEFHRDQGGGLAEPAFLLSWVCGTLGRRPVNVVAYAGHVSELPPGFNDLLDMIIEFEGGMILNLHYTLCEKQDWSLGIFTRISCDHGTILCKQQECRFYDWQKQAWDHCKVADDWTYETIYLEEMRHVLASLDGKIKYQGSLENERSALATLLAAEESSRTGQRVVIG